MQPNVTSATNRVSVCFLFGPELSAGWAPLRSPFEFALRAGAYAVPAAPRIGYEIEGSFEPSFTIWRVQPSMGFVARWAPVP